MQDKIVIKPDYRGVKMISYILILGSLMTCAVGYGHIQNHPLEDLPNGEVEIIIATPNSHGDDISVEDYQSYHDQLRENNGYLVLGYSLIIGMALVFAGSILIRLFRKEGVYIATAGACIAFIGGVLGNLRFKEAATQHLDGALVSNANLMTYVCGSTMGFCVLLAALPLVNAGARMALTMPKEEE